MLYDLIAWCIFGLIAGALARFFMPGPVPMGCLMTILLGVAGSVVGGFIVWLIHGSPPDGFHPVGLIGSVLGAVLLLFISRRVSGPRV